MKTYLSQRALALTFVIWLAAFQIAAQVKPVALTTPEVLFTNPDRFEEGKKDKSLIRKLVHLVDATPTGEEITVCVFKFELDDLADALLRADARGVKVRVIMNKGKTSKEANQEVKNLLKNNLKDFYYLQNTISKKGIIHNKFILFSELVSEGGNISNVVVQTSSNFQKKGAKKMQDMLIVSSSDIYYGYLDFWFDIKVLGEQGQLDEFDYDDATDKDQGYRAYFYPQRENGEESGADIVLEALQGIEDPSTAEIRFAHGKWNENREEVFEELKSLRSQGAKVSVVTNNNVQLEEDLEAMDKGIHILTNEYNLHTKFFLIKDGSTLQVWTGSHNLTKRSLYENFEVIMCVDNQDIYEQYSSYFERLLKLTQ